MLEYIENENLFSKFFIGRKKEKKEIIEAINSNKKELIAITGQRGIGKTFLMLEIKEQLLKETDFIHLFIAGKKNTSLKKQLKNLEEEINDQFKKIENYESRSITKWKDIFNVIKMVASNNPTKKIIIYMDEFSWFNVRGSGFLEDFGEFWNLLIFNNVKIILTGSEVSWINKNVFRNKGGLYHKTTLRCHLKSFDLIETKEYLLKNYPLIKKEFIIEYYLLTGGNARYLQKLNFAKTIKENAIDLYNMNNYFDDFFNNSFNSNRTNIHKIIIEMFYDRITLSFEEIKKMLLVHYKKINEKIVSDTLIYETLNELIETDVLIDNTTQNKKKYKKYTICDLFCFYYLRLNNKEDFKNIFEHRFNIIGGYALEILTQKNSHLIAKFLGRSFIYDEDLLYKYQNKESQIDLVLEYKSLKNTVSLIECKNYAEKYELDVEEYRKIYKRIENIEKIYNRKIFIDIIIVSIYGTKNTSGMPINDVSLLKLIDEL